MKEMATRKAMDVSTEANIERFKELFNGGMRLVAEACEVYVQTIDADKSAPEKFVKAFPQLPPGVWTRFELVGRKQMLPELLDDYSPMAMKLKRLPISVQEKLYGKSQQLITTTGDTLNVSFHHATPEQARQLFAADHVRTPAEQRAWLESKRQEAAKNPKQEEHPERLYEVRNGKFIINEACSFTKDQLIQILAEM